MQCLWLVQRALCRQSVRWAGTSGGQAASRVRRVPSTATPARRAPSSVTASTATTGTSTTTSQWPAQVRHTDARTEDILILHQSIQANKTAKHLQFIVKLLIS